MILYVDVFVTNSPLFPNKELVEIEKKVRASSGVYKYQHKLDITKYSLASYAGYKWSKVIIKYDLDDQCSIREFEDYCYSIFVDPIVIEGRSDCQSKFQETYRMFAELDDDFIFWVANNDHPMIVPEYEGLDRLVSAAKEISEQIGTTNISINYSHFFESDYKYRKNSPVDFIENHSTVVLEAQEFYLVNFSKGYFAGCQIFHKNLFHKLFFSESFGEQRVIRPECLSNKIEFNHYVVFPNFEICRHYDGYMHTAIHQAPYTLKAKDIPPLFIPVGFFENKSHIRYGFSDYDDSAININPLVSNYSFEDGASKTDLKMSIDQIPYFWRHLPIIKSDSQSMSKLKLAAMREDYRILNLWTHSLLGRLKYELNGGSKRFAALFRKVLSLLKVALMNKLER
jgi:hypothetical protein